MFVLKLSGLQTNIYVFFRMVVRPFLKPHSNYIISCISQSFKNKKHSKLEHK